MQICSLQYMTTTYACFDDVFQSFYPKSACETVTHVSTSVVICQSQILLIASLFNPFLK
jgi:hypothetical protein